MKRILLIAVYLLFTRLVSAQIPALALDEHKKYIYYQVVEMPGLSEDSLSRSAAYFIKEMLPKGKQVPTATPGIVFKDKFLTYTSLTKHESGEVHYALNIECKDSKYRYWLTDFTFTPYQRDRYGVFVPTPGIVIPLETAGSKLEKKELDGYLDQTSAFCIQLGDKLKKYLVEGEKTKKQDQPVVKKIVTDKW